ncbi:LysM peptidoglycan-binding domain-containing protein [Paenibacillus sp. FSL K6-1217]|uniref:LysM peptidoglycan-binding domain-containing protein n=1 Tax=Paenibacillus sp. FSL K6-1217 TaxID=2921466 RepID=UPI00324FE4B9
MKIHIVKQGDSLFALSQKYGVPLQKIVEANPQITNPDVLAVGDKVKIPAAPVALPVPDNNDIYYKHTVKQGDTLWKLSKAWGITLKDMIDANPQLKNPNALMTGEVVNIPKKVSTSPIQAQSTAPVKANTTPIQAQSAAPAVVDKTAIGGKTYTGVIEKPAPAPAEAPVPAPAAEAIPIPLSVPAPNKAPEVKPVQEAVHEKQSLYVQISVPAQEEKSKEVHHKTDVQPASWGEGKASPSEQSSGYPGLNENPYFMNYAPVYPIYEPMANMDMNNMNNMNNMNIAPGYAQPASFMPECPPIYAQPVNACQAEQYPGAWYPNAAPDYNNVNMSAVSPAGDNAAFAPQYQSEQVNLPWPSCGCGGMSIQPYPYEQPMYNGYPVYGMPQMGMVAPYAAGMNGMPNMVSPMYEQLMVSNIPPYPAYPGMENFAHNRVPEIQNPEPVVEEAVEPDKGQAETTAAKKDSKPANNKQGASKAKTSSQTSSSKDKAHAKPRSNSNTRPSAAVKKSGPWIPN